MTEVLGGCRWKQVTNGFKDIREKGSDDDMRLTCLVEWVLRKDATVLRGVNWLRFTHN